MIGKVCISITPFFDMRTGKKSFKQRPVLVIGGPRNDDYTVLPVSSVSRKKNLDPQYDKEVEPAMYPKLNLTKQCYVRTHKQTTIHKADLVKTIADMKQDYEELYLEILSLLEQFNSEVLTNAI